MEDNTYTIESPDRKWRAEISARLGANITKLQFNNQDIFVPLESEKQFEGNAFIIGSPMLFPANRTYKGEFEFQGKKYKLPVNDALNISHLHGFLYCQEFGLLENSPQRIVLCYENNGEIYPFKFKITVEYLLCNNGLRQFYFIENTGKVDMPFTFALHTTFKEPQSFTVPIDLCQEKDENHIPTGRYIELSQQEKAYTLGSESKGLEISGYYKACGNIAKIANYKYVVSDNFDHWVLYNGRGESGFLCVEPQCGSVNGLNINGGFRILRPQCMETFSTEIVKDI